MHGLDAKPGMLSHPTCVHVCVQIRLDAVGACVSADGYVQLDCGDGSLNDMSVSRALGTASIKPQSSASPRRLGHIQLDAGDGPAKDAPQALLSQAVTKANGDLGSLPPVAFRGDTFCRSGGCGGGSGKTCCTSSDCGGGGTGRAR